MFLKQLGSRLVFGYQHRKAIGYFDNELGCLFWVFVLVFVALEKYNRLLFVFRQLKSLARKMFSAVLDRAPICAQISSRCSLGMEARACFMFPGILVSPISRQ